MSPGTRRSLAFGAAIVLGATALAAGPVSAQDEPASLVYAIDGEITYLNNALNDVPTSEAAQFLYNALYRYDESLTPVPDLAAEPAQVSEDGKVWTIKLRDDILFQPTGTPLTADDVVFTFQIANSPNCRFNPDLCLGFKTITVDGEPMNVLQDVQKVDDHTVQFTLADRHAPFLTVNLPGIFIDSKEAVEAAFAEFQEATEDVTVDEITALQDLVAAEEGAPTGEPDEEGNPTVDYGQFRAAAEDIFARAGLTLPDEALFGGDEAAYVTTLLGDLSTLSDALSSEAIDRIAAAYPLLRTSREPVGTGPFILEEFRPGQDLTYVRNEQYHHGPSVFAKLFLPIIKDDVAASAALAGGDIDWKFSLTPDGYAQLREALGLKFALYPDFGYYGLQFNLREGRLFAEKPVRQALAYCIDKEATVEAATDGQGVPIYADIPPASWAYNPDIPRYEYDPAKAAELLEGAGWTDPDGDGVREKDGRLLKTTILGRAGKPDRIKFLQLVADQAKDCGFDLTIEEADFATVLLPGISAWPPIFAGQSEQWDAYFGGWGTSYDPDPYSLWHSSQCMTEELPETYNYICFQDEKADELIEAGLVELDQAKRAEIYKEFEQIMAEELPYLWAWSDEAREGLQVYVNGAEEWTEEVMSTPTWFWEIEKINTNLPS